MFRDRLSEVEAALDELQAEDLEGVPDARLQDEMDRLHRARARLEAEALRRAGAWHTRGLWAATGARSARAELGRRWQMGVGAAGDRLDVAARLEEAPVTQAAFADGSLSYDKARLLCTAVAGDVKPEVKDTFAACEKAMVEAATSISYAKVRDLMAYWHAYADPEGLRDDAERKYDRRGLSVSKTLDGMVAVDGLLDPETGQLVLAALEHLGDQLWRAEHRAAKGADDEHPDCAAPVGPTRTSRQQRADALGEMARLALGYDRATDRFDGRHRPRVTAHIDLETILGLIDTDRADTDRADTDRAERKGDAGFRFDLVRRPGVAMLADLQTPIPPETAARLICDAGLDTVITSSRFLPLAVSRSEGDIPIGIRRAVGLRDATCSFPGCDLPPRCCDVHHIDERRHGGKHSLGNCAQLCRRHHRLMHEGRWQIRIDPSTGRPVFTDPEGREHHADPTPRQLAEVARRRPPPTSIGDAQHRLPLVS